MPKRACVCPGCPACRTASGRHGQLFDAATKAYKCPACKQVSDQAAERQRAAARGTAAQRGYDTAHRQLREKLLAQWRPGDPCARCGKPMWSNAGLDLGHTDDRTGYRGLEHAVCNRGNR